MAFDNVAGPEGGAASLIAGALKESRAPVRISGAQPVDAFDSERKPSEPSPHRPPIRAAIRRAVRRPSLRRGTAYFFNRSRISVSSTCSAVGPAGAAGAASAFFFIELIARTSMKMTNAMIAKSITVWANFP